MIIFRDKKLLLAYIASLLFLVISFSFVYVKLMDVTDLLIIHFQPFDGIDVLGSKAQVYNMISAAAILNLLNAFLATAFYWRDRFLSYLLGFSSSFISLLILLVIWVIVSVN